MAETLERLPLREWRARHFMTQAELGAKIGVTYTTISHWEVGRKMPRVRHIRALAEALGIRPEQVIFEVKLAAAA